VYLAGRGEVMDDQAALARLFEDDVVGGQRALLAPGAAPLDGPLGRGGTCALLAFENTRLVARCHADAPALAVFVEQHDAGWTALVDGAPAPLLRANLLMRAVPVPPGDHQVLLSYRPPALVPGLVVSASSSVLLLGLWAAPWLRRRRAPGDRAAQPV
jgi:hypothetical protein